MISPYTLRTTIFIFVFTLMSGCFWQKDDDKLKGPKVAIAFSEYEQNLDWQKELSLPGSIAVTNLLEGLTDYDYDGSQAFIAPAMAEKWESHKGGVEWIFKIKKNIVWSDGKPLAAEHFLNSFKRLLSPENHFENANILFSVKNAREYFDGKIKSFEEVGIKALDNLTLKFELNKPQERFTYIFAHPSTYPMREEHLKMFTTIKKQYDTIPWLGPYKLTHSSKKRITLVVNDKSRWTNIQIKRVDLLTDNKKEKVARLLKEGKVNLVFNTNDVKIKSFRQFRLPAFEIFYLSFLSKNKPFNNPIMRRIFSHCINRDELLPLINQTEALGSVIPPGVEGFESNRGARYDPEMAKLVLKNARYENEIKKYDYYVFAQAPELVTIAKNLRDQWRKCLGVNIKVSGDDYEKFPKTVGMVVQKFRGQSLDAKYYLGLFDKSSETNITGWRNYSYEVFLRKGSYARAQHLLVDEEIPVLPLLSRYYSVTTQYKIRGLRQSFMRFIDLKNVTIERSR